MDRCVDRMYPILAHLDNGNLEFEFWDLELPWSLVLGPWRFLLPTVTPSVIKLKTMIFSRFCVPIDSRFVRRMRQTRSSEDAIGGGSSAASCAAGVAS